MWNVSYDPKMLYDKCYLWAKCVVFEKLVTSWKFRMWVFTMAKNDVAIWDVNYGKKVVCKMLVLGQKYMKCY